MSRSRTSNDATTGRLPFPSDLPARDRQALEEAVQQLDERERRRDASHRKQADELREDLDRRLEDLLGLGKLAELKEAIERERLAFRDLRQPPAGLGRDYVEAKKAADRRIDAKVRKLGTQPARLRTLIAEHNDRLLKIISADVDKATPGHHLESNLDQWMSLSPLHKHPLPWGV